MLRQSFSNADLVDEEPFLGERSCVVPQWRCYAKFISCQQILLTFLPASFTGTQAPGSVLKPRSNKWELLNLDAFARYSEADGVGAGSRGSESRQRAGG